MEDIIDCIEQIQSMRLQPDDLIIVTIDISYTDQQRDEIARTFHKALRDNGYDNKIILKPSDIDINILRKEDISDG